MFITPGNPIGPSVQGSEIVFSGQADGDTMYLNATTSPAAWVVLHKGSLGQVMTQGAAYPIWSAATPPIGAVIAWLKSYTNTPALPAGWLECNGQTVSDASSPYNGQALPDLNSAVQRFLRGSSSSGTTGGTETHTHSTGTTQSTGLGGTNVATPNTGSAGTLPSFYEVVWIVRVK